MASAFQKNVHLRIGRQNVVTATVVLYWYSSAVTVKSKQVFTQCDCSATDTGIVSTHTYIHSLYMTCMSPWRPACSAMSSSRDVQPAETQLYRLLLQMMTTRVHQQPVQIAFSSRSRFSRRGFVCAPRAPPARRRTRDLCIERLKESSAVSKVTAHSV